MGLQYAHGAVLVDAVLRPAGPCHLPAGVPPRGKAGHVRRFERLGVEHLGNVHLGSANGAQNADLFPALQHADIRFLYT